MLSPPFPQSPSRKHYSQIIPTPSVPFHPTNLKKNILSFLRSSAGRHRPTCILGPSLLCLDATVPGESLPNEGPACPSLDCQLHEVRLFAAGSAPAGDASRVCSVTRAP